MTMPWPACRKLSWAREERDVEQHSQKSQLDLGTSPGRFRTDNPLIAGVHPQHVCKDTLMHQHTTVAVPVPERCDMYADRTWEHTGI
eukprot:m.602268 g.602268  ORF g.602268 m.602268 type:complete len:87 (-) comp22443_c0_seq17:446-706(-)